MIAKFIVPGVPVGKARPRVTATHTYTPKKTKDYEQHIRDCWLEQSRQRFPDDMALELTLTAFFPIPKSTPKKKRERMSGMPYTNKPDLDNLIKSVCDSGNGCIYKDDSRIVQVHAKKLYSEHPRLEVKIEGYGTER